MDRARIQAKDFTPIQIPAYAEDSSSIWMHLSVGGVIKMLQVNHSASKPSGLAGTQSTVDWFCRKLGNTLPDTMRSFPAVFLPSLPPDSQRATKRQELPGPSQEMCSCHQILPISGQQTPGVSSRERQPLSQKQTLRPEEMETWALRRLRVHLSGDMVSGRTLVNSGTQSHCF